MNISSIRQTIENIDYDWKKPQTYVVFVPGLSLVVQKIQMAKILPLPVFKPMPIAIGQHNKFFDTCKWHLRGSVVQCAVFLVASKTFALPIFSTLALMACYEMCDTCLKGSRENATLTEFKTDASGRTYISKITLASAANIF